MNFETLGNAKGANFGWDHFEGKARYEGGTLDNHDKPVFTYSDSGGRCSITGGYVVRDKDLGAASAAATSRRSVHGRDPLDPGRHGKRELERRPGFSRAASSPSGRRARERYVVAGGTVYRIGR